MRWAWSKSSRVAGGKAAELLGGEINSLMFKKVAARNWFFDRNHGKLLYIFAYGNSFRGDGSDLLQFKVSLSYVPGNPGKFLNSTDAQDVMLVQVGE